MVKKISDHDRELILKHGSHFLDRTQFRSVKRAGDDVLQIREELQLFGTYESFSVSDLAAKIAEVERSHELENDGKLEVETFSYPYDSGDSARLIVRGWRDANTAEINRALQNAQDAEKHTIRVEQQQIEHLKKIHPELFK